MKRKNTKENSKKLVKPMVSYQMQRKGHVMTVVSTLKTSKAMVMDSVVILIPIKCSKPFSVEMQVKKTS